MECVVGLTVHVHPVALFAVVDSYERRQESSRRVIGTLLGAKEKGVVEIRSVYAVPHNETEDEVAVDMDFDKEMLQLHQRVAPGENVLGWFSTSAEVTMHSVLIHDYYVKKYRDPLTIFLTVDTTLRGGRFNIKAHVSSKVGIPGKSEGMIFIPVPCEVVYFDPEKVGVELLRKTRTTPEGLASVHSDFHQIESAANVIDETLRKVLEYVQEVIDGKVEPDGTVGRLLMEMVSQVPQFEGTKFEVMLNSAMQDLLMVVYLANLTKTQLTLGEKLQKISSH